MNKKITILYHAGCRDGFGGAWAAYKKFGNKAEYIPFNYQADFPSKIKGRNEVYFIDLCLLPDQMEKAARLNKKVVVIDHHKSQKDLKKIIPDFILDTNHSGSVLAWNYFHPQKPIPQILYHIQDMDLWKFKLPHTKEIISYLDLFEYQFSEFDKIAKQIKNKQTKKLIISFGSLVWRQRERIAQRLIASGSRAVFAGHKSIVVNSPVFPSEIGSLIVKMGYPVAVIWYRENGLINVSLRSDGRTDVSKIAKKYQGGGHQASAGFILDAKEKFPWKIIKKQDGKK